MALSDVPWATPPTAHLPPPHTPTRSPTPPNTGTAVRAVCSANSHGGQGAAASGIELGELVSEDVRMDDAPAFVEREGSAGAEQEDTSGHIPVFVGNLGDAIDE